MNYIRFEFIQKNILFFVIIIASCLVQISLNFLSFFKISQPYLIAIIIFLMIKNFKSIPSYTLIIISGLFYDFISGSLLGIHSLFFSMIKISTLNSKLSLYIEKNYGEWFLFCFVYIISLIFTKLVFIIVNLKIPDVYAISYNIGTTLLLFPIIVTLINLPKLIYKYLSN